MVCAMYTVSSDNDSPATKRRKRAMMSGYGLSPRPLGDGEDTGVCVYCNNVIYIFIQMLPNTKPRCVDLQ